MGASYNLAAQSRQPAHVNLAILGALAAILLSHTLFLALEPLAAQKLAYEDGLIENLGAAFSLLAAGLFVACYLRSIAVENFFFGRRTKRNFWFLGLAVLMLAAAGEETSWGQRIFGWQTPSAFEGLNMQGETNIHNLWFMHGTHADGTTKSSLALLLNANRLCAMFWLAYCVLMPLLGVSSGAVQRSAKSFGIPIPPVAIGSLFAANYLAFSLIVALGDLDRATISAFDELKESNYAFAFAVLGLCFLSALPARSRLPRPAAG